MAKATLTLSPALTVSQLDTTDWARAQWRAAYAMARRMIRQRARHGTGDALTWYLDHGFRRFGYAALPIVRAAGWAAFDAHHVSKAATGTPAELARQGMLTRCVRLERAPRGGWSWAWTHDPLAAVNLDCVMAMRQAAWSTRLRSSSNPARPYMVRLIVFSRLI